MLDPTTREPVQPGEDGVLFVSGPAVVIGYLNKELTERKFVSNPWGEEEGTGYERMYDTGDLVRMDSEGLYWFRGRVDLQAKVCASSIRISHFPCVSFRIPFWIQCANTVLNTSLARFAGI